MQATGILVQVMVKKMSNMYMCQEPLIGNPYNGVYKTLLYPIIGLMTIPYNMELTGV